MAFSDRLNLSFLVVFLCLLSVVAARQMAEEIYGFVVVNCYQMVSCASVKKRVTSDAYFTGRILRKK